MKRLTGSVIASLIFMSVLLLSGCASADSAAYRAEKGVIDLSNYDIESEENVLLNGEWAFYWDRFVEYRQINQLEPDAYVKVPDTWDDYRLDGERLHGDGYATYRLHLKTGLPEGSLLGLRIKTISSAYRLYINEKLIESCGTVGTNELATEGRFEPKAIFFESPGKEFDLIIQVSNFNYNDGGIWYGVTFGTAGGIDESYDLSYALQFFVSGTIVILAILNLIIYLLRRQLKYALYLTFFFILLGLSSDMFGQLIILEAFPYLRAQDIMFLWYVAMDWTAYMYVLSLNEFYHCRFSASVVRIYTVVAICFQVVSLAVDPSIYTMLVPLLILINAAGVVGALIIAWIGVRSGKKDGWLHIVAILVLAASFVHDAMYWAQLITWSGGEFTYVGMIVFIIIQLLVEALRIRQFSDDKVNAEMTFLQAQIKPHFLYNALNTIVSVSRYDPDQARELLLNLSSYLRRSFDFRDLSQTVPLRNEIELAQAYINIEKSRFQERLKVNLNICDDMGVFVPILILQPIIENAVNHGVLPKPGGGQIDIVVKREGYDLRFSVKDDGVGIAEPEKKKQETKRKYGSGVGLSNVNLRLTRLYGKGIEIKSTPGSGTEVTWKVPIDRKERRHD
jgi:signal transduction histidine kinase